ncbi:MAG TPA: VOC family protein [Mycobacteriales bacterium]|jgi:catechol 2,3-dioxygenase-like lactoylglutathione lyase family enzyme|nr:VOC family protein [Mycobacteriales bacterium]
MADGPLAKVEMAAATFYVADLDAAVAWYAGKLGLTPVSTGKDGHPYAVFSLGGSIVVLEPIEAALEPAPIGNESTTLNLVVKSDAQAARAAMVEKGVRCSEIVSSPGFRSFLFRDLDGNRYYFAQPAKPA